MWLCSVTKYDKHLMMVANGKDLLSTQTEMELNNCYEYSYDFCFWTPPAQLWLMYETCN